MEERERNGAEGKWVGGEIREEERWKRVGEKDREQRWKNRETDGREK